MSDSKKFYWKCPRCGTEQMNCSSYFIGDYGSQERCTICDNTIYCHHPSSTFPKKNGEIKAYIKD